MKNLKNKIISDEEITEDTWWEKSKRCRAVKNVIYWPTTTQLFDNVERYIAKKINKTRSYAIVRKRF